MKSFGILKRFAFILLLFFTYTTIGQGLKKSHHDFGGNSWNGKDKCLPCHTPNIPDAVVMSMPLWYQTGSMNTYNVYSGSVISGIPGGNSKLCLSCHDGSIAQENHTGNTTEEYLKGFGIVTTEYENQHPISFIYDHTAILTAGKLHDPKTTLSGLGGTIEEDMLKNGVMECTSCHDVHVSRNTQGCEGCHKDNNRNVCNSGLSLWKSNDFSALCLTCHKM